ACRDPSWPEAPDRSRSADRRRRLQAGGRAQPEPAEILAEDARCLRGIDSDAGLSGFAIPPDVHRDQALRARPLLRSGYRARLRMVFAQRLTERLASCSRAIGTHARFTLSASCSGP